MTMSLEAMAETLQATGEYRVLRRLTPRIQITPPDDSKKWLAIAADTETTGLDPLSDEIIELAMVPFTYGQDGRIYEVLPAFSRLREPKKKRITPEITDLTGITEEMVRGQIIDPAEVATFTSKAAFIVAHNAAFDRMFCEPFCDVFAAMPWGCSQTEIDWKAEGFEGSKLSYLLAGSGLFHDAHRAVNDCHAMIEILARPLPTTGQPAFGALLEKARKKTHRIWAQNSPFDMKDTLKAREYRWNDGSDGRPKAWFRDVEEIDRETEIKFLREEIYRRDVDILTKPITAYDRYSARV